MKTVDIRKMKTDEIMKKSTDLREEIADLRRRIHMGETQNIRTIRTKKRDLARMLTIMTEQLAKEAK